MTFGGTLILPLGRGPHPVIIVTPGAFRTFRDLLRIAAHNFVRKGVAALIYDARGTGASTGTVGAGTFDDFANDVLSAVEVLKSQREIDPQRIGLFGFSNSAWTVALAASRSKDVVFLILQSMSAVPPWKQEIFRATSQIRADDFPEDVVAQGTAFMELKFEVARTGVGWERLQAMMDDPRNSRWLPYTNPPRSLERLRRTWETQFSYDPAPTLDKLTTPLLAYYGDIDSFIPVQESVSLLEVALKKAGNQDYTIKIFPRGRHDLVEGVDGGNKESVLQTRYVPGFWDFVGDWLVKRTKRNQ